MARVCGSNAWKTPWICCSWLENIWKPWGWKACRTCAPSEAPALKHQFPFPKSLSERTWKEYPHCSFWHQGHPPQHMPVNPGPEPEHWRGVKQAHVLRGAGVGGTTSLSSPWMSAGDTQVTRCSLTRPGEALELGMHLFIFLPVLK